MKNRKKPGEKVKIYVPRKEKIKQVQQQIRSINRVLISA